MGSLLCDFLFYVAVQFFFLGSVRPAVAAAKTKIPSTRCVRCFSNDQTVRVLAYQFFFYRGEWFLCWCYFESLVVVYHTACFTVRAVVVIGENDQKRYTYRAMSTAPHKGTDVSGAPHFEACSHGTQDI